MSVEDVPSKAQYNCNGVTTAFAIPFSFLAASDIRAIRTNISTGETTELSDFTVDGSTLTTASAYSSAYRLTIKRAMAYKQDTDYVEGDRFPAEAHERALDGLTMQVQQVNETVGRALVFPEDVVEDADAALPIPEAGLLLGWGGTGKSLVNYPPTSGSAAALQATLATPGVGSGDDLLYGQGPWSGASPFSYRDFTAARYINLKLDFSAAGDGVADDTAAIQSGLTESVAHGTAVVIPPGRYRQTSGVTIPAGAVVLGYGATIVAEDTIAQESWLGSSADKAVILGLSFEGSGTAYTDGNQRMLKFLSSDYITLRDIHITKSRNEGLMLDQCVGAVVDNLRTNNNYGTGFYDRDGVGTRLNGLNSYYNGDTGVVAPAGAGGRGGLIWRCVGGNYSNINCQNNTEYGFRLYGQVGDTSGNIGCTLTNLYLKDNAECDLYMFDAADNQRSNSFYGVTIIRTVDPSGASPSGMSVQGSSITVDGFSYTKSGAIGTTPAVTLYNLSGATLINFRIENTALAASFSGTSVPDNVVMDNWTCVGVAAVCVPTGASNRILNGKFSHGGAGTTDIAINMGSSTVGTIENCTFSGFYRNVSWGSQAITIKNCSSSGTTDVALRMNGDGIPNLVISGNNWDVGSNPTILNGLTRLAGRVVGQGTAAPTTLTWAKNDSVWNTNAGAGGTLLWSCTTAGTPGTWTTVTLS